MKLVPLIILGVVLGLLKLSVWFEVGETLDNHLSDTFAWFVAPVLLGILMAAVLWSFQKSEGRLLNSVIFLIAEELSFWLGALALLTALGAGIY